MTETGFVPKARYMMRALELAAQAAAMGEVPDMASNPAEIRTVFHS